MQLVELRSIDAGEKAPQVFVESFGQKVLRAHSASAAADSNGCDMWPSRNFTSSQW